MLFFCSLFGQVLCEDLPSIDLFGDYPPGCNICDGILTGSNIGYTADDTISYDFPCGEVENSVWYSFYSQERGNSILGLAIKQCSMQRGLELAVFDESLNRVSDCISVNDQGWDLLGVALESRKLYYILIDGIEGDECEFAVLMNLVTGPFSDRIFVNPPSATYCVGAELCLKRGRNMALETYEWSIPPTDSLISGSLDNEEICLRFKSPGTKVFSVKVSTPCVDTVYRTEIIIEEGESLAVESMTVDTDAFCSGDTVQFDVDWQNESVGLDWSTDDYRLISGGTPSDTFFRGSVSGRGLNTISVTPIDRCGLIVERADSAFNNGGILVNGFICSANCFQFKDSCYFPNEGGLVIANLGPNEAGCDSFGLLFLTSVDVLPSPIIDCEPTNDGLKVEWEIVSGADSYIIFENRDSIATVFDNSYFLPTGTFGDPLVMKVQPRGECTYLPAEIDCSGLISNTNSNFLNKNISVYPNPTTGEINIRTDLKIEEIEIYDAAGRFLQKEKSTSFNLKNRKPGIYFLKIKTNGGVGVKRVFVN